MKLLLLLSVVLAAAAYSAAQSQQHQTFATFLTQITQHASFQRLTIEEQLLFGELVVTAENDELTDFVTRVGLDRVLELVKHLSDVDGKVFVDYLIQHMGYQAHSSEWVKLQHWVNYRPGGDDDKRSVYAVHLWMDTYLKDLLKVADMEELPVFIVWSRFRWNDLYLLRT